MSHDEERVNGAWLGDQADRAPRHWLDPFVGVSFSLSVFLSGIVDIFPSSIQGEAGSRIELSWCVGLLSLAFTARNLKSCITALWRSEAKSRTSTRSRNRGGGLVSLTAFVKAVPGARLSFSVLARTPRPSPILPLPGGLPPVPASRTRKGLPAASSTMLRGLEVPLLRTKLMSIAPLVI